MDKSSNNEPFTQVPNKILENIPKMKLTQTQLSLLLVIWRYTYGFHRKEHRISLSFLAEATNRYPRDIQRSLKKLEARKIIYQNTKNNQRIIRINDNCHEWIDESGVGSSPNRVNSQSSIGSGPNNTIGEIPNQEINKEKTKDSVDSSYLSYNSIIEKLQNHDP